ncbi:unnamed protein product [Arctogadus glacialis]
MGGAPHGEGWGPRVEYWAPPQPGLGVKMYRAGELSSLLSNVSHSSQQCQEFHTLLLNCAEDRGEDWEQDNKTGSRKTRLGPLLPDWDQRNQDNQTGPVKLGWDQFNQTWTRAWTSSTRLGPDWDHIHQAGTSSTRLGPDWDHIHQAGTSSTRLGPDWDHIHQAGTSSTRLGPDWDHNHQAGCRDPRVVA